ncbi:MAG: crossover junction endodeoxyribonuclease RuvC [Ignavibacteriae bacterium]|nr:crossover junction endodeoxyribonuclease RuvC [Ignavibacteriota bacterium]
MTILGVDPGTLTTGYGVIEISRGTTKVIKCDAIKNDSTDPMPQRLKRIFETLSEVMDDFEPDIVAIETAFYGKNAQSALKLGHARGVIMLAAVERDIPTHEYSPREIKKALVGHGNASKQQVHYMITSILNLKKLPKGFDTTDALAVAMCHLQRSLQPTQKYTSWKSFLTEHPDKISQPQQMRKR